MFFKDNFNPNFRPGESLCASNGLWGGGLHWGGQHLQEDLQTQVSTISSHFWRKGFMELEPGARTRGDSSVGGCGLGEYLRLFAPGMFTGDFSNFCYILTQQLYLYLLVNTQEGLLYCAGDFLPAMQVLHHILLHNLPTTTINTITTSTSNSPTISTFTLACPIWEYYNNCNTDPTTRLFLKVRNTKLPRPPLAQVAKTKLWALKVSASIHLLIP